MKKLLVLAALTILTTSSAGCCNSSWYPGKYLGRTLGHRNVSCSTCGDEATTYVETYSIPAAEVIVSPGPVDGK